MSSTSIGKRFTPARRCEYYVGRTDSVNFYLNSIRSYNVMTPREEEECLMEYKRTHDISKRNLLVSCNQRYVYALAKRLTTDSDVIIDLINEGNIGLIEAIDRYDAAYFGQHRNNLMMYASSYVMKHMLNYFVTNKMIPNKWDSKFSGKIANERNSFFATNGRFPTNDELRDIFVEKYDCKFKDNLAFEQFITVSIEDKAPFEEDLIYGNSEEFNSRTSSENDYVDEAEEDTYRYKSNLALSKLSERDRKIMKMLFGINGAEYSVDVVADMFGLTPTRVLQIKRQALAKMNVALTA